MIDRISETRILKLHPKIREEVLKMYREQIYPALTGGVYCRITHTLRTFEEQNELYKLGRTKLFDADDNRIGIVTNAKGGQSWHNWGLAIDVVIMSSRTAIWDVSVDLDKDGKRDWFEVIDIFKRNGWEAGADWKGKLRDFPHFQKTFGYTIKDMLKKWNDEDVFIDNGIKYVNL
jgi:peptidoglycan L-alanyl-D-glutamate endopeptidase CwlK